MHSAEELAALSSEYLSRLPVMRQPSGLYEPIRYALDSGGKRLRPLLTLMGCDVFSGDPRPALPVAAAFEVFHNFTLLHDDIMDNAVVRRGRPTVCRRFGRNAAILSGDAMLITAYGLLRELPGATFTSVTAVFDDMALKVCEGQQYDMDFETREAVTMDEYMTMIGLKTAALISAAVVAGGIVGGADRRQQEALRTFGWQLGLAFQVQDDRLDTYGTPERLGKNIGGDIAEGKKTYLMVYAAANADPQTAGRLAGLLSDRQMLSDEKYTLVREIYDRLGVDRAAREEVGRCTDRAMEALDALDPDRTGPLRSLAAGLLGRDN